MIAEIVVCEIPVSNYGGQKTSVEGSEIFRDILESKYGDPEIFRGVIH